MRKIFFILSVLWVFISCENDFSDWNKDPKNPAIVPGTTLFSSAQRDLVRRMKMQSVGSNIFNFFAQYWTATTYPTEAQYDLEQRDVSGNFWNAIYYSLNDLKKAKEFYKKEGAKLAEADKKGKAVNKNNIAIVSILEVFSFHVLVDVFGDIPYSQALDINNTSPKYDDAKFIYNDLFKRLDAAINNLDTKEAAMGSADFIYGGNVTSWKKFANSLKLRMAMRVAKVIDMDSEKKVQEAVAGGVFTSNSDNAAFKFKSSHPYANPLWESLVRSGREDLVVADTFVNALSGLGGGTMVYPMEVTGVSSIKDPRAEIYMKANLTDGKPPKPLPYKGGPYGKNNSFSKYTHLGEIFHKPDFEGVILDYVEVEFLLAEAAAGKIGGITNAEEHYNKAIKASIKYWTKEKYDEKKANDYIAHAKVKYDAFKWKKSIGIQKWIAMYSRGFEGWTSWRVFGYPELKAPSTAIKKAENKVPLRYIYPLTEAQRNGANYKKASEKIGGDKLTTKIFWDKQN